MGRYCKCRASEAGLANCKKCGFVIREIFDYNATKLQINKLLVGKEDTKLLKELQDKIVYLEYGKC